MEKVEFNVKDELKQFVNCIMTGESASAKSHTNIPLYADQSHFIRVFKKYTGQTPSYYLRQLSSTL